MSLTINTSNIVSVNFKEEKLLTEYSIVEYRTFLEWILGKPKKTMLKYSSIIENIYTDIENLNPNYFIRDNKVWQKPHLYFSFSNGHIHKKFFKSAKEAILFKSKINFINTIEL